MKQAIKFILNGQEIELYSHPTRRLLDILREDFGLMGTKEGCGEGECGACAVLINDKLINSCLVAAGSIEGADILTIEGFKSTRQFEVLQQAFADAGAIQCGYCTPGMMMAAQALLLKNPKPAESEVREAISGNLCRCTGYNMIVEAIQNAAVKGEGIW